VTGPEAESHLEIAMSVASGQADTGLAVRAAATALGLSFVPLAWEDFDIVLSGDALPAAEPLISALRPGRAVIYLRARRLRHVPRGLGGNAGLITRLGRG
jgi:molybdate-binding protein